MYGSSDEAIPQPSFDHTPERLLLYMVPLDDEGKLGDPASRVPSHLRRRLISAHEAAAQAMLRLAETHEAVSAFLRHAEPSATDEAELHTDAALAARDIAQRERILAALEHYQRDETHGSRRTPKGARLLHRRTAHATRAS